MSADNGIYVLKSRSKFKETSPGFFERQDDYIDIWRVAHVQGIDNLDWFKEHQPWNVGAYLYFVFEGQSKIYYSREEAWDKAISMAEACEILEYGICSLNLDKWNQEKFGVPFVFYNDY